MNPRLTLQEIAQAAAHAGDMALPLPPDAGQGERAFDAPWQAHAFGLTLLLLHARGVFT